MGPFLGFSWKGRIEEADFSKLTGLKRLTFHNCRLTQLPQGIEMLEHLELLDLSGNEFTTFPKEILSLPNLKALCIGPEALKDVPDEVGNLEKLEILVLNNESPMIYENGVLDFPHNIHRYGYTVDLADLYKFHQVKRLDLSGLSNDLLRGIDFSNFPNLAHLALANCNLDLIPDSIFKLQDLVFFDFFSNQIDHIPLSILNLKKLQTLILGHNQITQLDSNILNLQLGKEVKNSKYQFLSLDLRNNPIKNVPLEIIDQGKPAISNYFRSLEKGDTTSFYTAKLMIVGRGRVGKTTLLKKLTDPDFKLNSEKDKEEETTWGIDIKNWNFPDPEGNEFETRIWDFGGQQKYHTPHQFFLTRRSVYLYVWDALQEETETTFTYWLNMIRVVSENSRVIIVMNKADLRPMKLAEDRLQNMFPNIVNFHQVSCISEEGLDTLREEIKKELLGLDHIKDELPFTWKYMRDELEKASRSVNYITEKDYLVRCKNRGLDKTQAQFLSDYLHDLGAIMHFKDIPELMDTVVLNPDWLIDALYALIDDKEIIHSNGKFTTNDLKRVWNPQKYPTSKYGVLISLMEKFGLCFNEASGVYILPMLLHPERPVCEWENHSVANKLVYKYEFMPSGIMVQFIVRNHARLGNTILWKHGVFAKEKDIEILIEENSLERQLSIELRGEGNSFSKMAWIVEEIEVINNRFFGLQVDRWIPCICSECEKSEKSHLYSESSLLKRIEKGKKKVECDLSYEDIDVQMLINRVVPRATGMSRNAGSIHIPTETNILELIKKGKLLKVAEEFIKVTKGKSAKDQHQSISFAQRANELRDQKLGGLSSENELEIKRNRLTKDMLEYLDDLKN